jgi:hypothetical protein
MDHLSDVLLYDGASIDIGFGESKPTFGDLYLICGDKHPSFPPTSNFRFESLSHLQFEQVDDFFGVRALNDEGEDVPIWLYPLLRGQPVHHHPGPFDGFRLDYNILRNPVRRADHYSKCVAEIAIFGVRTLYRCRNKELGAPPDLSIVRNDVDAAVRHWASQGIEVGAPEALEIDF